MSDDCPIWYHDPTDEARYAVALDGKCPSDGHELHTDEHVATCRFCRRVFYAEDGRRVARTWWSPASVGPSTDELNNLLVRMLRSARPHPVEHPAMWQVWGDVCTRLGLNPDDYRIPTCR